MISSVFNVAMLCLPSLGVHNTAIIALTAYGVVMWI